MSNASLPESAAAPLIRADGLERHYPTPGETVRALDGISFEIGAGEAVAIVGTSGSGKSTLLSLLGGLERPTGGALWVAGSNLSTLGSRELARYRRTRIGMVFQSFNLIPRMTARENVELPMILAGQADVAARRARALHLLETVGLGQRAEHRPAELSGGEQQRVAIARALANDPELILADEPTGNLDRARSLEIMDLLLDLNARHSKTLVLVTHDDRQAARAQRILTLVDGRLADRRPPTS